MPSNDLWDQMLVTDRKIFPAPQSSYHTGKVINDLT